MFQVRHSLVQLRKIVFPSSLSQWNIKPRTLSTSSIYVTEDEKEQFETVYTELIANLNEYSNGVEPKFCRGWLEKILNYNVLGGKQMRGMSTVRACKRLIDQSQLTPEYMSKAYYMGWCSEMLHSFWVILDDVIDESEVRRGKPCWYRLQDVGMQCLNDAVMVECAVYHILDKYFDDIHVHRKLRRLFREVTFGTAVGQHVDLQMQRQNVREFSMEKYNAIMPKAEYMSYYLTYIGALIVSGQSTNNVIQEVKPLLFQMGHLYQVQDDFLDCFGDPTVRGKQGNDIEENKCSWLAAMCVERSSSAQKKIMEECYGQKDPEKVHRVKLLYEELNLPEMFSFYELNTYNTIEAAIEKLPSAILRQMLIDDLNKMYKRQL